MISAGQLMGVVLVFHDATEERRLEEEQRKVQRLESVGVLAGGIAHDFNNILTGILGNVDLAMSLVPSGSQAADVLSDALKASWRAHDLTRQLLTFAKGGAPVRKAARVSTLVRETTDFALRGSNVRCEYDFAPDLWLVEVDSGQIAQVISNLVINADQAMPEGGALRIRAENVTEDTEGAGERYVVIEIADQGVGIPAGHLARIFEPYFTTKQKGSGLGLAVAYSVVKQHGGYIEAESRLGEGTTFRLYLPAADPGKVVAPSAPAERGSVGHGRVLIMDDEEMVRQVAARALRESGFRNLYRRGWRAGSENVPGRPRRGAAVRCGHHGPDCPRRRGRRRGAAAPARDRSGGQSDRLHRLQ